MTARPKLLIVDDGDRHAELAHEFLRDYDYATRCDRTGPCWECPVRAGCTLTHAHDLAETEATLARHRDVDAVLLDVRFDLPETRLAPSRDADLARRQRLQGLDILARLRRAHGDLPVILMTSQAELDFEEGAFELAADEFVTLAGESAFDARALALLVERVLGARRDAPAAGGYVWGSSAKMARLRRDLRALAPTSLPLLITGETGTGKSAIAERVVHAATTRRGTFVSVDLSALPSTLVAAELFGTARGAFSGAVDRPGRLEAAQHGTLLLDEIGNLPLELQRMLLLVLESGRVTRLGESHARPVDVKLVAATNRDLGAAVRAGTFRDDLYARLNPSARLSLPPLRERIADLEPLMDAFVRRAFASGVDRALLVAYCDAAGGELAAEAHLAIGRAPARTRGVVFLLSPRTLAALRAHTWPGNVRELELLLRSAAVLTLSDALTALRERRLGGTPARALPLPEKLVRELLRGAQPDGASGGLTLVERPQASLRAVAQDLERQLYVRLFEETGGDFAKMAARLLGRETAADARRVQLRFNQLGLRMQRTRSLKS